ncbi:hypothetical protein PFISCL1PPCAC_13270, partial [Pristionchus fissidentatus]
PSSPPCRLLSPLFHGRGRCSGRLAALLQGCSVGLRRRNDGLRRAVRPVQRRRPTRHQDYSRRKKFLPRRVLRDGPWHAAGYGGSSQSGREHHSHRRASPSASGSIQPHRCRSDLPSGYPFEPAPCRAHHRSRRGIHLPSVGVRASFRIQDSLLHLLLHLHGALHPRHSLPLPSLIEEIRHRGARGCEEDFQDQLKLPRPEHMCRSSVFSPSIFRLSLFCINGFFNNDTMPQCDLIFAK